MKVIVPFLLSLLLCCSCGSIDVAYDYDENIDFSSYTTYNYINENESGLSPLDLDRVKKATDSILTGMGYHKSKNPGLLIDIIADQYEKAPGNTIGIGVGGGGSNVGVGVGGGIPLGGRKLHQTITLNLVDAQANDLIWQAVSDSNVKINTVPEQRMSYFKKLVEKIFKSFPPEE